MSVEITKYKQGKIYRLVCEDGYSYIGSTCCDLAVRFYEHMRNSKKAPKQKVYDHILKLGWDKVEVELIENFPCQTRQELIMKEDEYIRKERENPKCLNVINAFRTREDKSKTSKEYYNEHKEEILEVRKQHYINNKEKIREYQLKDAAHIREMRRKRAAKKRAEKAALSSIVKVETEFVENAETA